MVELLNVQTYHAVLSQLRSMEAPQRNLATAFVAGAALGLAISAVSLRALARFWAYAGREFRKRRGRRCIRIVFTGGPCAGKTTCVAKLPAYLASRGIRAMVVPEIPTLFVTSGSSFDDLDTEEKAIEYQVQQLLTQLHLEDSLLSLGTLCSQPLVLLMDRGTQDGAAYVTPAQWARVLERAGVASCDPAWRHRYDCVIHLVTAAEGAEGAYGTEGHESRFENAEEARATEWRTREAWASRSDVLVVDNSTDFAGKLRRVFRLVDAVLGLEPGEPGQPLHF